MLGCYSAAAHIWTGCDDDRKADERLSFIHSQHKLVTLTRLLTRQVGSALKHVMRVKSLAE